MKKRVTTHGVMTDKLESQFSVKLGGIPNGRIIDFESFEIAKTALRLLEHQTKPPRYPSDWQ